MKAEAQASKAIRDYLSAERQQIEGLTQARDEALECAAQECDTEATDRENAGYSQNWVAGARRCAARIRAKKGKP